MGGIFDSSEEMPVAIPNNPTKPSVLAGAEELRSIRLPVMVYGAPYGFIPSGVRVRLVHPWVGDLKITLTNPLGKTITLLDRINGGACAADGLRIVLSDYSDDPIAAVAQSEGMIRGHFKPDMPLANMFDQASGPWFITVYDLGADATGFVEYVEIMFGQAVEDILTYDCVDGRCVLVHGEGGEFINQTDCQLECGKRNEQ